MFASLCPPLKDGNVPLTKQTNTRRYADTQTHAVGGIPIQLFVLLHHVFFSSLVDGKAEIH